MALSRESPRVAVSNRPALWSPDFPRFGAWHRPVPVPRAAAARPTRSLEQTIPQCVGAANYGARMTRLVALLRGINVGGIRIRMADLKEVFDALGFENVRTVLASGNVLFDADDDPATAKAGIEAALTARFGYEAYTFVLEQSFLTRVVEAYPFDATRTDRHSYVVFVSDPAVLEEFAARSGDLDPKVECIEQGEAVLYWQVEKGSTLDSAVGKQSGAARYKATTTVRNLNTLRRLI